MKTCYNLRAYAVSRAMRRCSSSRISTHTTHDENIIDYCPRGSLFSSCATDYTLTVKDQNALNGGGYNAFMMALNNACFTMTPELVGTTTVTLDNMTIMLRSSGGNSEPSAMKIAIYDEAWGFVGLSNEATGSTRGETYTLSFTNVTLDVDTSYRYVFMSSSVSADQLSEGGDPDDSLQIANQIAVYQATGAAAMLYATKNMNTATSEGYVPAVSFSISTPTSPAVPEPATATLSLLALAGLAARRRRK